MSAVIIDGQRLAKDLRAPMRERVERFTRARGRPPTLGVILAGANPASLAYVASKERAAKELGMRTVITRLDAAGLTASALAAEIAAFNAAADIDAFLVQLPLPPLAEAQAGDLSSQLLEQISPFKDADGLHPLNLGRLLSGTASLVPCTPAAVLAILKHLSRSLAGARVVIVGRSLIVGKPLALLCVAAGATVTICHSQTQELEEHLSAADIVVVAIGKPRFIQGRWLKKGATVIDVGITRLAEGLVGDVDFRSAVLQAAFITPVPGGVGPLTVTMLLNNTLNAALEQANLAC